MRKYVVVTAAAALTGTTSAQQSASSLTFWLPGPANNPAEASRIGFDIETYPPVASIITSNEATTIFKLGCPSSVPASLSHFYVGTAKQTCSWATDAGTYSIISSTQHILHRTGTEPEYSASMSCDYNTAATQLTCAIDISGDVNDNTGGPVSDIVFPDKMGNVVAFATAEVVTEGRFNELECGNGYRSRTPLPCNSDGTGGKASESGSGSASASVATRSVAASGSAPTASQGSGVASSEATRTASGSVATASTGAAARLGVEGAAVVVMMGVAALSVW